MQPSGFRVEGRAAGRAAKLVQLWPSLAQVEQCGTSIIRVRARRGRRRWAEDRWSSRRNGGQSGRTAGRREAVLHPAGWRRKRLSRQKGGGGRYCPPRRRRQSGEIDLGPAGRDCRIQPLRLDEIAPFALGGSSDIIARPGHRDTRAIPAKARAGAKAVEVLERALPGEMRIGDASTSLQLQQFLPPAGWSTAKLLPTKAADTGLPRKANLPIPPLAPWPARPEPPLPRPPAPAPAPPRPAPLPCCPPPAAGRGGIACSC